MVHMEMESRHANYINDIPNVSQQMEELGSWVFIGCVGGSTSIILLFIYLFNVFVNIKKNPSWTRRYQAWVTSLPMAVSFLSLSSFFVPRAAFMCEAIKFTYMPFILMFFVEVTLIIGGGEKILLDELEANHAQWSRLPAIGSLQYCGFTSVNKKSLRVINGLIYQAFVFPFLLNILMAILEYAELLRRDHSAFLIINILNMLSFAFGSCSLCVLVRTLNSLLESKWPKFKIKYDSLNYFIVVQKTQYFFISIFAFNNSMLFFSTTITWKTFDAAASMLEAFIFGILFFVVFKVGVVNPNDSAATVDGVEAVEPSMTSSVPQTATANKELAT